MKHLFKKLLALAMSFLLCTGLLWLANKAAYKIKNSDTIAQSIFLGRLISKDADSLNGMLKDPQKLAVAEKFIEALTSAYVDFEFIPYRENETFIVVLKSVNKDIQIDRFAYSGKNLIIEGSSKQLPLEEFRNKLELSGHFDAVDVDLPDDPSDNHFVIICYAKKAPEFQLGNFTIHLQN